jgi:hypothetical protein
VPSQLPDSPSGCPGPLPARTLKPEEAASAYAYASTSVDTQEPDS